MNGWEIPTKDPKYGPGGSIEGVEFRKVDNELVGRQNLSFSGTH